MTYMNGSLQVVPDLERSRKCADVIRRIADVNAAERNRVLRAGEKEVEVWLADFAMALQEPIEVPEEAHRLGISKKRIRDYRENALLLRQVYLVTDYAAAVALVKKVPGVEEITSDTYEEALRAGKQIKWERKKGASNTQVAQRMIPVLFRCEYVEGKMFVQKYFLALHDSFARKVLQSIKEKLRAYFPSFGDRVLDMAAKVTTENVYDFFFAPQSECVIALGRVSLWIEGKKRRYALLLERRTREEEIEVLDIASVGMGPNELFNCDGLVFRYKTHMVGGKTYPELRHLQRAHHELYLVVYKLLRDSGWMAPDRWPYIAYPRDWK